MGEIDDWINKHIAGPIKGTLGSIFVEAGKTLEDAVSDTKIQDAFKTIDDGYRKLANLQGLGKEQTQNFATTISTSIQGLTELGMTQTEAINKLITIQSDYTKQTGRNLMVTKEQSQELVMMAKLTGQETNSIMEKFFLVGKSLSTVEETMMKGINSARELGVNAQAVSSNLLSNMSALDKFSFQGGVEG